jgi:hypothetical protein
MKLGKAKIAYKEALRAQLELLSPLSAVEVTYVLFPGSRRLLDKSNVLTIHEKFFMDALVELNSGLQDDNFLFDYNTHYSMGKIDKENPRVEIHIKEVKPRVLEDYI